MGARPSLGFESELDGFDPAEWDKEATAPRPPAEATRRAAGAAGFRSREPEAPAPAKMVRRRRTGRNAQFNIKARPETIAAFAAVADAQGWGLGETLEHAVALLEKAHGKVADRQ